MTDIVKIEEKFARIDSYWSPKIVAEVNGQYVKIAKVKGEFVWHDHKLEDELFYIYKGQLWIDFEDRSICLEQGDMHVVRKGILHRPRTNEQEAWIVLFEPKSTKHSGDEESELTNNNREFV